ncbi:MAG: glycerol-3-phosphate 1-O-acyltransferase PlsY [candidate division WOR-3 bacterium]
MFPRIAMTPYALALSLLLGFVCGSIPFGYFAGRLKATDIRRRGSGNIGFTNVLRTLGWAWALPVLILDVAKGLLPAMFAGRIGLVPPLVGLAAVTGHVFTPWLRFSGGKGVATAIGVTAFLCPRALLAGLAVYLITFLGFGFVSLASLSFSLVLPLLVLLLYPGQLPLFLFSLSITFIIIFRHRANIERLSKGAEPRLGLWLKLFQRER